ncbi:MAG TPA: DUF58 domain-containing protein [Terrimesophilobacter sp.]|nr:DUF58 domain-containing protein [Terrimesophilobacter sp.]
MDTAVRFGRPVQRRGRVVTLTLRGGTVLAAGVLALVVAYIAGWPELLIIACFCGIPPLLALVFVVRMRPRLSVARFTTPAIVTAGTTGSARLRLGNLAGAKSSPAHWRDYLPWGPGATRRQGLPVMDAGASLSLQYAFTPPRRGIPELGPLVIEVADPFGFARGEFPVGDRQRVVVAPETVDLSQGAVDIASDSGSARLFQHRALAGEHDIMTRDYRPGDALRRVHWKASAHHGDLMVREDEKRSHAEALILVDTRRGSYRDVLRTPSTDRPESEHFEWALSMVASLRDHLVKGGLRVRVMETAVAQLADADHVDDFVESLARVRLSYQDGPALILAEPKADSVGSLFAVLDDPDGETLDALLEQRGSFDLAVAFLLGPPGPGRPRGSSPAGDPADRLERAGWTVHRVVDGEGVAAAWHALGGAADD